MLPLISILRAREDATEMSTVGPKERITQQRVVRLFQDDLKYAYLGDWNEREDNRNVEESLLKPWLVVVTVKS